MFNQAEIPKKHYDATASLRLISNNASAARELALLLKSSLPEFKSRLEIAIQENNVEELQLVAHKLHGGVCYVAVPRLKYLVDNLETACKQYPEYIDKITPYIIPSIELLEQELAQAFP